MSLQVIIFAFLRFYDNSNIREKFLLLKYSALTTFFCDVKIALQTKLHERHRTTRTLHFFSLRIFSSLLIMNRSLLIIAVNCNCGASHCTSRSRQPRATKKWYPRRESARKLVSRHGRERGGAKKSDGKRN